MPGYNLNPDPPSSSQDQLIREQTYTNLGYPSLTLTINETASLHSASKSQVYLHCSLQYEQSAISITFQHVSGEYFMIHIRLYTTEARRTPDDFEINTDGASKAEFRIGEDGAVKELGILLETEMGEAKIWFRKAGTGDHDEYKTDFDSGSLATQMGSRKGASGVEGQIKLFSGFGMRLAPLFSQDAM